MTPMDSAVRASQSEAKEQIATSLRRDRHDGSSGRSHTKSAGVRRESNCQFPQMKEFTHFHYDQVEFDTVKLAIDSSSKAEIPISLFAVQVVSQERFWTVHRGFEDFLTLDTYLHRCIYDRQISRLQDISRCLHLDEQEQLNMLTIYLSRVSDLIGTSGSMMNCGTVLNFFELDNHGRRLMAAEDSAINIPAIAAAHCVQRYIAQASDELSLEVGDMVSVIDMPPAEDTNWWRGKKNFEVGLFPAECVEVIGGRTLPQQLVSTEQVKPVLRRRGKIISFLRMFFSNRPQRSVLKQSGIVKERVFGCDLGEHLLNSGLQVPYVLTNCIEFVETFGMIDGIYRLTGVTSNVQKLRFSFDEGTIIDLSQQEYLSDLHCVTAVLKMYFRELPNPLLTYHLYGDFAATLQYKDEERLRQMQDVVRRLPPPNYRTAKRLFTHLHKMAHSVAITNMDTRNLAIVWAPNLMRCKALDNAGSNVSGMSVLNSVSLQATVTEFIISHADLIFTDDQVPATNEGSGASRKPRPTSMLLSPPGRLLSLAEAQGRLLQLQGKTGARPVEIASIAMNVNPVYHTIIEFPGERGASKLCISPLSRRRMRTGNTKGKDKAVMAAAATWKAIFSKHAGAIGLKNRHKEKTKPAEDGIESEDEQQLSEIGHLSRQKQQGSLPSVKKAVDDEPVGGEGRRVRLLSERSLLEDCHDDPGPRSAPPSHASESNLVRSASHESFFDGDITSMGTPGVVLRPAYKENAARDLVQPLPAPTWRRTKFHSKSPSPVPQPRIPYVPTPNVDGLSDRVEPYLLQRSPSVGRRSVICLSPDNEASEPQQPLSAASAAVAPTAFSPGPNGYDDSHGRSRCSSDDVSVTASASDETCASSASRTWRSGDVVRAGSLDNLASAAAVTDVVGEGNQTVSGSSEQLRELMSHWESSDRLLVATQGLSARTHRLPQAMHHDRLSPPAPSPRAVASQSDTAADEFSTPWRSQPASDVPPDSNAADSGSSAVGAAAVPSPTAAHGDCIIPLPANGSSSLPASRSETHEDGSADKSCSDCRSGGSSGSSFSGSSSSSGGCTTRSCAVESGSRIRWRRKQQPPQLVAEQSPSDVGGDSPPGHPPALVTSPGSASTQSAVLACRSASPASGDGIGPALHDDASRSNDGGVPLDETMSLPHLATAASAAAVQLSDLPELPGVAPYPSHVPVPRSCPFTVPSLPIAGNRNCSNRSEIDSDSPALSDHVTIFATATAAARQTEVRASVADTEVASAAVLATSGSDDVQAVVASTQPDTDAVDEAVAASAATSLIVTEQPFEYETGTARREAVLAFSLPPVASAGISPLDLSSSCQQPAAPLAVAPSVGAAAGTTRHQPERCEAVDGPNTVAGAAESCNNASRGGAGKPPRPQPRLSLRVSPASGHGPDDAAPPSSPHPIAGSHRRRVALPLLPPVLPSPREDAPGDHASVPVLLPAAASLVDGESKRNRASAVSPGQCAFRWISSPAAMELPSPASAAVEAVAVPPPSFVRRDQPPRPRSASPSKATNPQPGADAAAAAAAVAAVAAAASDASESSASSVALARDVSSMGAKTSALYAAVILEAARPSGLPTSVTLASPDITDAFKAFSGM